ncbi:hypothetical protein LPJ64_000835 [Coemansia asiatica]|uniref:Uncharacterized protein n=1 Tax=Coemansia asiatica TaxID=1052880 RepID=A0A9W8CMH7_9FUNG|nr:hypothetical protein LPJ64_000835 [Coemansia asiatica]
MAAPVNNVSDGCPNEPESVTCDAGQTAQYIAQNSVQCAHYICKSNSNSSNNQDSNGSSKKSVLLPAVLGSVIPLAAIAAGIVFFLHRRHRKQRSMDAQHEGAKYMSSYNNLEDDGYANGPMSPSLYSSTYSASKWRDSAMRDTEITDSHASIPIIFSSDQGGDQPYGARETKLFNGGETPAYRETKLYNHSAQTEESRQWAAPNVVNLKQKPQLVVLNGSAASPALKVDNNKTRELSSNDSSCSNSESPATPLTPETPFESAFSEVATPVSTQKPRIVQVGRPQVVRNMEVGQSPDTLISGSPLRVATRNWGSGSEESSEGSDSEHSGSKSESESGSESEEESGLESGSESEENNGNVLDSESEEEEEEEYDHDHDHDENSDSEASDDEHHQGEQGEDSGPEGSDFHSEYESESDYESENENSEHESDYSDSDESENESENDNDNQDNESDSGLSGDEQPETGNNNSSKHGSSDIHEAQSRLSLGPTFKLEASSPGNFSSELLSAAESIAIK